MAELLNTELGVDLMWSDDADQLDRYTSGIALYKQDILHRITTPRGSLYEDPGYGRDVRGLLSKGLTQQERAVLPRQLESEIREDPRTDSVTVSFSEPSIGVWRITITGNCLSGPFELVADVSRAGELTVVNA